jgi:hypothetical protein
MITSLSEIEAPRTELGYPDSQLKDALDEQQYKRLWLWMRGQTCALIDGEAVVYPHDLARFLSAGHIID